ncbi:MAG TPA: hypothetical protein VFH43_09485, partial [Candidatus Kapabacteria bacterium]|nr:hypothetical protein [Candidatus Kapabacteria bacterium]
MPAEFTPNEISILSWLLPANRPYYAQLRQSLSSLLGKWTDDGLEFGNYDQDGAETVAIGQTRSGPISLSLSEDRLGAMLFAPPAEDLKPIWTLSCWLPGESSPQGHS